MLKLVIKHACCMVSGNPHRSANLSKNTLINMLPNDHTNNPALMAKTAAEKILFIVNA